MANHPKHPGAPTSGGMTDAARDRVLADLASGRDEFSPAFLYSVTSTSLLLAAAAGLIDPVALARSELASRGLDRDGVWCGFARAAQIHGVQR
jgi:hypothetical protein